MNWSTDWITATAAAVQALGALVTFVVTCFAVRWAHAQAKASRESVASSQDAMRASLRPIVVPARDDPKNPPLRNIGPGPALNLVVRVFVVDDSLYESAVGTIAAGESIGEYNPPKSATMSWRPSEEAGTLLEILYHDVYGTLHRTLATHQNGKWSEVCFDNAGDIKNYMRFYQGTTYYRGPEQNEILNPRKRKRYEDPWFGPPTM